MTHPVILIVDDQPDSADILGMLLGLHYPEWTICVAYGGQSALDRAQEQKPDVGILDLEMPGMDGEKLASALRSMFPENTPLLIALSGNLVRLAAAREKGAFDHHFSKPADVANLMRALSQRLNAP